VSVKIGSKGWQRAERIIRKRLTDNGGEAYYSPALERGKWEEVWVVGETSRSWICATNPNVPPDLNLHTFKVPKTCPPGQARRVLFDAADVELYIWASAERYNIASRIHNCPPEMLAKVAKIVGYETLAGLPSDDGEPYLIYRADGPHLLNRKGECVNDHGRPITAKEAP